MPKSLVARVVLLLSLVLALAIGGYAVWLLSSGRGLSGMGADGSGPALVGGPFELVDQQGQARSDEDFRGSYMLVFFGYTFCPDVCPTTLADVTQGLNLLAETAPDKAARVTPVFITVDPERDRVEALAEYASYFHPRLVALTGTPAQIETAIKAYRIYAEKTEDDGEGNYLMDHSAMIYLMGPDGAYLTFIPHGTAPADIAEKLNKWVKAD
jgi:protein SCO1/2